MKALDKKLLEQIDITLSALNNTLNETMDKGSIEEIKFYKSLQTAIELKDTAPVNDYLNSNITLNNNQYSRETYDFMRRLEILAIETAKLNFDSKFKLLPSDLDGKDTTFLTIALTINMMLEELEEKVFPTYYFEKIFDLLEMPAVITDMFGKIRATSTLWERKIGHSPCQQDQIDEIIKDAIRAMTHVKNMENATLIKNAIIISPDGNQVKGYDVKVKHLFKDQERLAPEGFLFVCVPSL